MGRHEYGKNSALRGRSAANVPEPSIVLSCHGQKKEVSRILRSLMDPGLWRYVAEGGKHVVFAFSGVLAQGDNDDDKGEADKKERVDGYKLSIFEGCVLRISKADLAMAATVDALHEGEENISEEVASIIRVDSEQLNVPPTSEIIDIYERHERSRQYLKQVIQPRVGSQYVDLPRLMRLSLNFSHQFYQNVIFRGQ